ncbi:MAG TPA: LemA family protein [Clostridiaceae bacterium]|jgi:LemA protein|nr:LemA family protein [Clostridiaceae bacterium]HBF76514.1 LemA family protein [Clostridiaceae bacterium]HBG38675.1 LemA family protein [Clostridiaceae bacterium]HBN28414.1 LemA family protein [Clostridiaceae bacterium]HBX48486.1 LemA family protein [Clostridiaceae bacterium]
MKKIKGWVIGIIVIAIIVFWGIGTYNGLVSSKEKVTNANAQIQEQLQRRNDLIPNLVNTVKGYAAHEKEVMESVANARAKLAGAKDMNEQAAASDELSSAISRLLVVVEKYPDLKADANFRALMDELAGTENRISQRRRDYNNVTAAYNAKIKRFPTVIIARMTGFNSMPYFEASPNAQSAPDVKF